MNGFQPAIDMIMEPRNRLLAKKFGGVPDMVIPGAASSEKQMGEIEQMLQEPPIPNVEAQQMHAALTLQAMATGAPPPPPLTPEQQFTSSLPIDEQVDDNEVEGQTGKDWINSPEGQQAKRENPQGFLNVRLHTLAHLNAAQKKQQQSAGQMIQQAGALEVAKAKAKATGQALLEPVKAQAKVREAWGKETAKAVLNPPKPNITVRTGNVQ